MKLISVHNAIPQRVGRIIAIKVHLSDFVSALTVRQVVEQGQWKSIKIIVFKAVVAVQPFDIRICFIACRSFTSVNTLPEVYIIKIRGKTISFAGKPNINAVIIIPSRPIIFPSGSRKSET